MVIIFSELLEGVLTKKRLSDEDLVVLVTMQDVDENATIKNFQELKYKDIKSGLTYFEKGDVLVAKITPCFENGKGASTEKLTKKIGFGSTEFHVLRANNESDSRFIYYQTKTDKFRKSLEAMMVGSAGHRRVPFSAIQNYELEYLPHKTEQTAIANALSDVDELLVSLDKLIAKKRDIKTATMQQLLTGKKRLPEFEKHPNGKLKGYKQTELGEVPEDWEVVALGNIGEPIIGLTYSPSNVVDFGTLVLRSSNVQNNQLAFENNVYVDMDLPERVIVKEGDILICVRNGSRQLIGKCALIDKATEGQAFGAFMCVYRTQFSGFIFYQFQSTIIQNQINEIMGATINQITNKDMAGFRIPLPVDNREKDAIANVLSDMDKDIEALESRLAKTQKIKQGMMQELLTGRVRLV